MYRNHGALEGGTFFGSGSNKDHGSSPHGVVMKAVGRETWMAVPLKICTAMAAEVAAGGDVEQNEGKGSGTSRSVRRNMRRTNDF